MTDITKAEIEAIENSEAFLPQVGKGSGWVPQPVDSRDIRFSTTTIVVPPSASMRDKMPRVRDQGQIGSCTGFATAYAVGALVRSESDWDTVYSPLFVYNNAREMIGEIGQDYGAYIRDAVKSVNKFGIARENDFMYYELEHVQFKLPPESAYESARSWRLGEYRAVTNIAQLKSALAQGQPVVGGFLCYENLGAYSTWNDGIVLEPTGAVTGGHAVCFTGYDDTKRLVQFINSWGSYWGDDGFGYLPYSFFETNKVSDMWALTKESELSRYPNRAPLAMPV